MEFEDLTSNPRLASLMEMLARLAGARTPADTLTTVLRAFELTYGPRAFVELSTSGLPKGQYRIVLIRLPGSDPHEKFDPWGAMDSPVHEGGVIGRIIANSRPQIVHDIDWPNDPFFLKNLPGYRSLMAVPFSSDRLPMNWILLLDPEPTRFTAMDLEESVLRAALVGSLLNSQALAEELAVAHAQIDKEVQRVGEIQRSLLPDPLPAIPGLEVSDSYETFGEAGGDLYDFIPLGAGSSNREPWGIFIGDASGHGPSAAVVMAMVEVLLHAHPAYVTKPTELLRHLNEHLCGRRVESSFVTAFLAVYDPPTTRLTYASAGHPPPLLKSKGDGTIKRLDQAKGYPLGIDAGQLFTEGCVEFARGDSLLLYTDGISEARNASGVMFDIEGIESALRACDCSPRAQISALRQAVKTHLQGLAAKDDQTLVAIRRV